MKKLIWTESELFKAGEYCVASSVYDAIDAEHRKVFKRFNAHIDLEINEKELFPNSQMWGFPTTNIVIFHFSITPRYNNTEKFLELEFPFMSVHNFMNSHNNNHVYFKTVEEGKEYAEKLYETVMNMITTQQRHRLQKT